MGFVGDIIGDVVGGITGADQAAQGAQQGAQISADAQRAALEYLKEREKLPQQFREGALNVLGGLYGLGGANPQDALAKITGSAAYQNVMSARDAGEEAILRTAGATGGLRSGNTIDATARYAGDLQREAFNQGLQGLTGLANLPSNANQIAQGTANIGNTLAQGQIAAGAAQQAGFGSLISGGLGALGPYLGAGGSFSDSRLKDNVKPAGQRNGHNWYTWTWSKEAEKLGLYGSDEGVMAHEVAEVRPEAVRVVDNYLTVDYSALGVQ